MTDHALRVGALFIALGSTLQMLRWAWVAFDEREAAQARATKRSENVQIERRLRGRIDVSAWALITVGAWYTFFGSL